MAILSFNASEEVNFSFIFQIVLVPKIDSIPFFQPITPANDLRRQEYERYRCGEAYHTVLRGSIPDVCKKYNHHIGFYVIGGAFRK